MLRVLQLETTFIAVSALSFLGGSQAPSTPFYLMPSSNLAFDKKIKDIPSTYSSSSGGPGTSGSATSFYHAHLDKGQRKLSSVHVQMYVRSVPDALYRFLHSPVITRFAVCVPPIPGPREHRCLIYTRLLALSGRVFCWAWASSSQ